MNGYLSQFTAAELNLLALSFYLKTYPNVDILSKEMRIKDLLYDLKYTFADADADDFEHITTGQAPIKSIPLVNQYLNAISKTTANSFLLSEDVVISKKKKKQKTNFAKIDNIIIVDPAYKKFDLRKKTQEKFIASEKSLLAYNEQIRAISNQLNITDTIVSSIGWTENDTTSFYNHSLFKRQIEEILTNGTQIISTDFELVDRTCKTYNSNHLALMGTYSFHIQKDIASKIIVLVWSAFIFPTFPLGVYYCVTPKYDTYTYLITINSRNQAIDFKSVRLMKFRDSKGAINSSTYYQLLKMKKGK